MRPCHCCSAHRYRHTTNWILYFSCSEEKALLAPFAWTYQRLREFAQFHRDDQGCKVFSPFCPPLPSSLLAQQKQKKKKILHDCKQSEEERNTTLGALPGWTETWGGCGGGAQVDEKPYWRCRRLSRTEKLTEDERWRAPSLIPSSFSTLCVPVYSTDVYICEDNEARWRLQMNYEGKPNWEPPRKTTTQPFRRRRDAELYRRICAFQMQYHCFRFFYSFCVVRSNFVRKDCGQIFSFFIYFFIYAFGFGSAATRRAQTHVVLMRQVVSVTCEKCLLYSFKSLTLNISLSI